MIKRIKFKDYESDYVERCINQKRREKLDVYKRHYLKEYQRGVESDELTRFPMSPLPDNQVEPFVDIWLKEDSDPKKLVVHARKISVVEILKDVWGARQVEEKRLINDFFVMLGATFESVEPRPMELLKEQAPRWFETNIELQVVEDIQQVIGYLVVSKVSESLCDHVKHVLAPVVAGRIANKTDVSQIVENLELNDIQPLVVSNAVTLEFVSHQYKLVKDIIVDQ